MDILAGLTALAVGVGLAYVNYLLSRYFLTKNADKYAVVSFFRLFISVAYLFLLFFIGQKTKFDVRYLLLGGAFGVTLPSFAFTVKLLKLPKPKDKEDENG